MLKEDTIIQLLKTEAQKLIGNLASFQKFNDKFEFNAKVKCNLDTLNELFAELREMKK